MINLIQPINCRFSFLNPILEKSRILKTELIEQSHINRKNRTSQHTEQQDNTKKRKATPG